MKVFSTFFRIMWKYKNSVMIYFVMFAGLSIVFGAIAGDSTKQVYKESDVLIAVFDYDKSKASEALYSYLNEKSDEFLKENDYSRGEVKEGIEGVAERVGLRGLINTLFVE